MPKIFFCYRRDDSTHQAGRIFDHLASKFGRSNLFKDVDSMSLGVDFRKVLTEKVAECDVLLALIGDIWLTVSDGTGRRLENPRDFVRIEIESALRRRIPVIPVLVGRAPVPAAGELPTTLRELQFRNGLPVRPDPDFHHDIDRLIRGIEEVVKTSAPNRLPSPAPSPDVDAPWNNRPQKTGLVATLQKRSRDYFLKKGLKPFLGEPKAADSLPPNPNLPIGATDNSVRVGILKSGNASYVNEIDRALLASLESRLAAQHLTLSPSHDCVEWEDQSHWSDTVDRLLARGGRAGFRMLVGIGTQAAAALQNSLGPEFGMLPTLLLGVTYPRIAGLVDSEHYRCETRQIMCIRYGCGLDAVSSLLHHHIFPGRKLCFVFQAGVPQDELAHDELRTTRLAREGTLRFLRLEHRLTAADIEDTQTVYFSWYTFTRLFHEKEFLLLKERLTVSIMQDDVRDGITPVSIGTDHLWIGDHGAELIAEHIFAPEASKPNWGSREVIISPLVYWLNDTVAKKHGIHFPKAVLDGARKVYE